MSSTKLRRLSLQEGDGSKLRRFNALYPKTIIKQHVLNVEREKERKKQKRLELQEQQKNTILSTCKKSTGSTSKSKQSQRRLISSMNNNLLTFKTPTSRLSDYNTRISSRLSSNSHYEGVKQIFLKTNFKRPKYQEQQLIIVDPYIDNKENFSNVYNLRPNRTIDKLVANRKQSYSMNKNFLLKSPKSHTTLLSVRSLNFL
ncbi:unnamed protein product [Paramecium primaurelia]|uniref:Uncharacterized protein n=1 Tax=Paramecium primaurelia TaxID=5886 RepID=A0A8S1K145_PARPR|nr:unnamed protein product [Paramecium primaurelia]CAD8044118.1 unnamed protein product [Paramecium primaurelia]